MEVAIAVAEKAEQEGWVKSETQVNVTLKGNANVIYHLLDAIKKVDVGGKALIVE